MSYTTQIALSILSVDTNTINVSPDKSVSTLSSLILKKRLDQTVLNKLLFQLGAKTVHEILRISSDSTDTITKAYLSNSAVGGNPKTCLSIAREFDQPAIREYREMLIRSTLQRIFDYTLKTMMTGSGIPYWINNFLYKRGAETAKIYVPQMAMLTPDTLDACANPELSVTQIISKILIDVDTARMYLDTHPSKYGGYYNLGDFLDNQNKNIFYNALGPRFASWCNGFKFLSPPMSFEKVLEKGAILANLLENFCVQTDPSYGWNTIEPLIRVTEDAPEQPDVALLSLMARPLDDRDTTNISLPKCNPNVLTAIKGLYVLKLVEVVQWATELNMRGSCRPVPEEACC